MTAAEIVAVMFLLMVAIGVAAFLDREPREREGYRSAELPPAVRILENDRPYDWQELGL